MGSKKPGIDSGKSDIPAGNQPGRGSSVQGPRQDANGAPQGANQGGAPRGGSRVEPSHRQRKESQDRAKKG